MGKIQMIRRIAGEREKAQIASGILNALPDWFGLPESTANYIDKSREMPFWAFFAGGKPVGFLAMKRTSPDAAEIYVMGVLQAQHRSGIGRALCAAFEEYAREQGCSYAHVKTVQMGHYEQYDQINRFYRAMGFRELECFPTLWEPQNPCQVYIKWIGSEKGAETV